MPRVSAASFCIFHFAFCIFNYVLFNVRFVAVGRVRRLVRFAHPRRHAAVIRVHGILHRVEGPPLKPEDTEELMRSITSEEHIQSVRERGGADFGFAFGDAARFRVSVFKEKGNFAMVLRQIPSKLLTMEQIGIPPSAKELLYKPRGLVLVTGPTGSGKTTTLASMINIINEERDEAHIITIEDPIEYYHKHKKALVTQREIGVDVPNFAEALAPRVAPGPGHDSGR